ncbi:unnamed protein product, partial [Meganyctiphanes norvegica]
IYIYISDCTEHYCPPVAFDGELIFHRDNIIFNFVYTLMENVYLNNKSVEITSETYQSSEKALLWKPADATIRVLYDSSVLVEFAPHWVNVWMPPNLENKLMGLNVPYTFRNGSDGSSTPEEFVKDWLVIPDPWSEVCVYDNRTNPCNNDIDERHKQYCEEYINVLCKELEEDTLNTRMESSVR